MNTMSEEFTSQMVRFAERLADESRAILKEVADDPPDVTIKADASYVTETDKRIETYSRIAEMDRTASAIVSGNLGRRVPVRGNGDEFDRLADSLNAMLDGYGWKPLSMEFDYVGLVDDIKAELLESEVMKSF